MSNLSREILERAISKTEANRHDTSELTTGSRNKRQLSSSVKKREGSSSKQKVKRLLNDGFKKGRKPLYQSNSSKRLNSAKQNKRGSTPRRRKDNSADSRKKISNSFSRGNNSGNGYREEKRGGYHRPPLAKKGQLQGIEKYRNESKGFFNFFLRGFVVYDCWKEAKR